MKGMFILAWRNIKETVREPLSLVFCIGFPLIMLVLMQVIFMNMEFVPANFAIESYASGICVFGFTFTGLFVALQISSDKNTSFIRRINISPINKLCYYGSYFFSALPVALCQTVLFFCVALIFGFPFNGNFFLSIIYLLFSACFYIFVGLLIGSLCANEKQTGPVSSIFISLTGILGGVFMPVDAFKGGFATFINLLPFSHSVQIASELQTAGAGCIYPHVLYLLGYIAVIAAVITLIEKLKSLKK